MPYIVIKDVIWHKMDSRRPFLNINNDFDTLQYFMY